MVYGPNVMVHLVLKMSASDHGKLQGTTTTATCATWPWLKLVARKHLEVCQLLTSWGPVWTPNIQDMTGLMLDMTS